MGRLVILLSVIVFAACSTNNDEDVGNDLEAAMEKWASSNPQNYTYEFTTICFCFFTEQVRVVVEDDSVVAVLDIESNQPKMVTINDEQVPVLEVMPEMFYSINDFFERLVEWTESADESELEFNEQNGMPITISFDHYKEAVDDEITYLFSALEIN